MPQYKIKSLVWNKQKQKASWNSYIVTVCSNQYATLLHLTELAFGTFYIIFMALI